MLIMKLLNKALADKLTVHLNLIPFQNSFLKSP